MAKISSIRARGCKKALKYYVRYHTPRESNWLVVCQIGGEYIEPTKLTAAHKINRSQIKAGEQFGEHLDNIWAACWDHHRELDLRPKMKKELMKQKVSCLHGGVLKLTKDQKQQLGVK